MSRLGFDKAIVRAKQMQRPFLERCMKAAQDEFNRNFSSQSDAEKGEPWPPLSRIEPPPKLIKTGALRRQACDPSKIIYSLWKARLVIDPIDDGGRGYASYHQDGENQSKSVQEFQRRFVTQSSKLTDTQLYILRRLGAQIF